MKPFLYCVNIICFFAAPFFTLDVISKLVTIKKNQLTKPILYISCSFLVGMIIYVGDLMNLPPTLLVFLFVLLACTEGNFLQRFSVVLILCTIAFSFNALMDSYTRVGAHNISRFILWLCTSIIMNKIAVPKNYELSPHVWIMVDLLTVSPFSSVMIVVLLSKENYSSNTNNLSNILILIFAFLSTFALLWTIAVLAKQQALEKEKVLYQMNKIYYEQMEQDQFQVRRLRHDMANHLQAMHFLPHDEMQTYLEKLIETPAMTQSRYFCENNVANAVLMSKQIRMEQAKISFDITAVIPSLLPIDDVDLCALFANTLDNAIEACEKLPPEKRKINLKAITDKGLFVMQIQNPTVEILPQPAKKKGLFATTKKDKTAHGFGLTGIDEIVNRYGGTIDIVCESRQFTILLSLPV